MEKKDIAVLSGAALLWIIVLKPAGLVKSFILSPGVVLFGTMFFSLGMSVAPAALPDLSNIYTGNPYADFIIYLMLSVVSAGYYTGQLLHPFNYAIAGFLGFLMLPLAVLFVVKYSLGALQRFSN